MIVATRRLGGVSFQIVMLLGPQPGSLRHEKSPPHGDIDATAIRELGGRLR